MFAEAGCDAKSKVDVISQQQCPVSTVPARRTHEGEQDVCLALACRSALQEEMKGVLQDGMNEVE